MTHYTLDRSALGSPIFSLRKYSGGVLNDIMATIEVSVFLKRIVQAKGKMNKPISEEAKKYMESWAAKNTLTSPCLMPRKMALQAFPSCPSR